MAKIIMGLDLSINGTAIAVLKYYPKKGKFEVLETVYVDNKKIGANQIGAKLNKIVEHIEGIISRFDIDYVVKERGFSRYNTATQMLYRVQGVVEYVTYLYKLNLLDDVSPTTIKKIIGGQGTATKKEVAEGLKEYLINPEILKNIKTDDETDAIAVAIASQLKE